MAFGKLLGRAALSKILGEPTLQNLLRWRSDRQAKQQPSLSVSPGTGSTNKALGKNQLPLNTFSGREQGLFSHEERLRPQEQLLLSS